MKKLLAFLKEQVTMQKIQEIFLIDLITKKRQLMKAQ